MSGADDDTELRDLLIQTLDSNGVLGKIKVSSYILQIFLILYDIKNCMGDLLRGVGLMGRYTDMICVLT